jgi:hypothetical protein
MPANHGVTMHPHGAQGFVGRLSRAVWGTMSSGEPSYIGEFSPSTNLAKPPLEEAAIAIVGDQLEST